MGRPLSHQLGGHFLRNRMVMEQISLRIARRSSTNSLSIPSPPFFQGVLTAACPWLGQTIARRFLLVNHLFDKNFFGVVFCFCFLGWFFMAYIEASAIICYDNII